MLQGERFGRKAGRCNHAFLQSLSASIANHHAHAAMRRVAKVVAKSGRVARAVSVERVELRRHGRASEWRGEPVELAGIAME